VRAEIAAANLAMTNLKDLPTGTVKITCPEVTASHFMPKFLGNFLERFPGVSIDLLATNHHIDLIREQVDFAFRVGTVSHQDFVVRKLAVIKRVLVASPDYLAKTGVPQMPNDLLKHRCLLHDALPEWPLLSKEGRAVLKPTGAARSDSLGFLLQSAVQGNGIALLPAYVCQPALGAGQLITLLPNWEISPHDLILVRPDRKNQSKAQTAFSEFIDLYDFTPFSTGRVFL
jgi:DNA-binding transcriptional LysR family regulator